MTITIAWRSRYRGGRLVVAGLIGAVLVGSGRAAEPPPARSVLDLQSAQRSTTIGGGRGEVEATLTDLNPGVRRWYLLTLESPGGHRESFHLENPSPHAQTLRLDRGQDGGRLVLDRDDASAPCVVWSPRADAPLRAARDSRRPYVSLCEGRLFLRNPTAGHRTRHEWAADLLRDRIRYGDRITSFIKEKFYRDRYLRVPETADTASPATPGRTAGGPADLIVIPDAGRRTLTTPDLNLVVSREDNGGVRPGRWLPLDGYPGIFAAVMTPGLVAPEIVERQRGLVNALDAVESSSVAYLVAFDLSILELGFALGTDHPRVGWSDRVPDASRDPALAGPDGFATIEPLVRTGKLNPRDVDRVAATFAGGFKRSHGAFKWGDFAVTRHGSHYGFIESGVVLSTLQPGLATLVVHEDGRVEMKTWREEDGPFVSGIRHARQNGVPILEIDPVTGMTRPGTLVRDWGRGNWSGSEQGQLRTLRGGVCLHEHDGHQFLIYGYFTGVTPSAMARVFAACGCRYAMQLDINAPEHTYLAVYRIEDASFVMQRLVGEMAEVDPPVDDQELPRFIGYADNRDFFYLLRRSEERESR